MATPHINAPEGAFAKTVLMPGDPLRAKLITDLFLEDVKLVTDVRNVLGFTGTYKGIPVSVMASGMGQPSIGIYSYELYKFYGVENIIRIGSAGSYCAELNVQDLVLADSAFSESTFAFAQNGCPDHVLYPNPELNAAILKAAEEQGIKCIQARIHSSDVFYTERDFRDLHKETGAGCVEMESFALFHNANALGKRAACLLTISDSFVTGEALSAEARQTTFRNMFIVGLEGAIAMK